MQTLKEKIYIIHTEREKLGKCKYNDSSIYKLFRQWKSVNDIIEWKWGRWWNNSKTNLWKFYLTDKEFDRAKKFIEKWYKLAQLSKYFNVSEGYFYNHKKRIWLD